MSGDSANLDCLRSFAVLLVLFDHTAKLLGFGRILAVDTNWIGRLGVAFFFVHTSLVLMLSLQRNNQKGWRGLANFYLRRAFRIYPLSVFFILLTCIFGIPQAVVLNHSFEAATNTPGLLLSNLTLTQNFTGSAYILGQLWSLPIEIDMYLALPFLYVFATRWPKRFLWVTWPLAVALALTAGHVAHLWRLNVLQYAPCFIPGVMAYALSSKVRPIANRWLWPAYLLGLAILFLTVASWHSSWAICLTLGMSVALFREQTNTAVNRITHAIAKYSYGIYLGHTFCLWMSFVVLASRPWFLQWGLFFVLISLVPYAVFVGFKPRIVLGKKAAEELIFAPPKVTALSRGSI